jgi:guanylate kinase
MRPPAKIDPFQSHATMISGTLFIVAAPSGAGKTTLVSRLMEHDSQVRHSISFTTRAPRPGEQDGREYHFIDVQHFLAMRERGEFAEWAEVHGNFYGTSRHWLEQRMTRRLRHVAGDRLAGRPANAQAVSRGRQHIHPAALDRRTRKTAAQSRRR